jgi:hypothetical protein
MREPELMDTGSKLSATVTEFLSSSQTILCLALLALLAALILVQLETLARRAESLAITVTLELESHLEPQLGI